MEANLIQTTTDGKWKTWYGGIYLQFQHSGLRQCGSVQGWPRLLSETSQEENEIQIANPVKQP